MKKKTITAALVMAGMLILSLPLGAHSSLSRLREKAEEDFYYDSTQFSIWEGVEKREEAALNLVTLSRRYEGKNDALSGLADEVERAVKLSESTYENSEEKVEANQALGAAAEALCDELGQTELSEKDARYPESLIREMTSQEDQIERSSYNDAARAYNEQLEKFPIRFLRHMAFLEPLPVYGE